MIDKVAWVQTHDGRILVTRNRGRRLFYLPGGRRETGESDAETLAREIQEELSVRVDVTTMEHVGTYHAPSDAGGEPVRMTCYRAAFKGELAVAAEIEELAWFTLADWDRVTGAEQQVFETLRRQGTLMP